MAGTITIPAITTATLITGIIITGIAETGTGTAMGIATATVMVTATEETTGLIKNVLSEFF